MQKTEVATAQRVADYDQRVELLQRKIANELDRRRPAVLETMNMIEQEGSMLKDYIVPIGGGNGTEINRHAVYQGGVSNRPFYTCDGPNNLSVVIDRKHYAVHDHALSQIAGRLDLPIKLVRKYLSGELWQRALLLELFNENTQKVKKKNALVRVVGGEVRSYLSDKYKRMNSIDIYAKFIAVAGQQGARLIDAHHDGIRGYVEAIMPTVMPLETEMNGIVPVIFGAQVSNSDHGDGALDAKGYFMDVRCMNGYVGKSFFRKTHMGSRLTDDIRYSEETYRLDTQAMVSAIGDVIDEIFSPEIIKENLEKVKRNASMEIDMQQELKMLPSISMHSGILVSEVEAIEKKLMDNNPADGVEGGASMWKLTQAMTAVANDIGGRRSREIQEIAYSLLK